MPIEINMRLGGAETWSMIKSVYGVDLLEEYVKIACGIEFNPRFICISKNFHPETNRELRSIQFDLDAIQRDENIVQICMVRGANNKQFGWFVWKEDLRKQSRAGDQLAKAYNKSLNLIRFEYF
jgi:hypothetical protein